MMNRFLIALQFLTIVPVRINGSISEADIVRSTSAFVIVGLIQGMVLVLTDYTAGVVFHADLVMGIVLLVLVVTNGGFHLDGLADTVDAIAARGDRERKLAVMRGSATGPVGATAIVFDLALKYLSLKNLSHMLPFTYYSSLYLMPVVSKWCMVIALLHGKPARKDGLGKMFIGRIGAKEAGISTLMFFVVLAAPPVFFSRYVPEGLRFFYLVLPGIMYLLCRMLVGFFHRKFGGQTGDTLGALSEITEILFLLMVIAWSRFST